MQCRRNVAVETQSDDQPANQPDLREKLRRPVNSND